MNSVPVSWPIFVVFHYYIRQKPNNFVFNFRLRTSFKSMFPKNRISEVASEVCKEHLAFCRVKIKVGRERAKKENR